MGTFLIVFIIPIPIYSVVAGVGTLLLVGCPSFVEPVLSTRLYKNNSKFEKRKENWITAQEYGGVLFLAKLLGDYFFKWLIFSEKRLRTN